MQHVEQLLAGRLNVAIKLVDMHSRVGLQFSRLHAVTLQKEMLFLVLVTGGGWPWLLCLFTLPCIFHKVIIDIIALLWI
jgi:hypothetical protein